MILACELCGSRNFVADHHMFSQTKANRKLYPDFIDDRRNLQRLCVDCHANKKSKLTEREFCSIMGIEPRGKVEKAKLLFKE